MVQKFSYVWGVQTNQKNGFQSGLGIIVSNPLEGEELYTQMGFLFGQFWPIGIFVIES